MCFGLFFCINLPQTTSLLLTSLSCGSQLCVLFSSHLTQWIILIITGYICKEHLSAHFGKNYSIFTLTQKHRKIQYVLHILFLLLAAAISSRAFMWWFPAQCLVFHNCNRDLTQELKYTCFRLFIFFILNTCVGENVSTPKHYTVLIVEHLIWKSPGANAKCAAVTDCSGLSTRCWSRLLPFCYESISEVAVTYPSA